ncbi:MAG: SDR family oxidoreductase [Pseudomonadota bacterium]
MTTARGVALVTGGASGIGEACARRFAKDGYRIAILDVNMGAAEAVAGALGGPDDALSRTVDVSDHGAVDAAVAEVAQLWGRIDICVASAGILENASTVLEADPEAHDRLWQVNYNGTVNTCRAVGKVMQAQRSGAMITLGSINSYVPLPLPAYCPSKTAITRLTELLAVELGRFNVRVNGLAPTYVLTPALQARIDSGDRDPDVIRTSGALDMFVMPDDIANAAAFLCSDQARAITGIMLPVDAGHLAWTPYQNYAGGVPWQT